MIRFFSRRLWPIAWLILVRPVVACDLCAIYSADNAREQRESGLFLTLSESFIASGTTQFQGNDVASPDYRNSSVTHLVPGYNFTRRLGLSLNVPFVDHRFRRQELRYSLSGPPVLRTEHASESGLGDLSLISRATVLSSHKVTSFSVCGLFS